MIFYRIEFDLLDFPYWGQRKDNESWLRQHAVPPELWPQLRAAFACSPDRAFTWCSAQRLTSLAFYELWLDGCAPDEEPEWLERLREDICKFDAGDADGVDYGEVFGSWLVRERQAGLGEPLVPIIGRVTGKASVDEPDDESLRFWDETAEIEATGGWH